MVKPRQVHATSWTALRAVRKVATIAWMVGACCCLAQAPRGSEPPPYLGQKPPGRTPELFAPDLLNHAEGYHSAVVFSADGSEAYFAEMSRTSGLRVIRWNGKSWDDPKTLDLGVPFGGNDPSLSVDGNRLCFLSFQPLPEDPVERERIWCTQRSPGGWRMATPLAPNILAHPTHWTFSESAAGTLYFTSEAGGGQDIVAARREGGRYLDPADVGPAVNTPGREFCPFITPDERCLLFSRVGEGTRKADLYVACRGTNGEWTDARPLGAPVNSEGNEVSPVVSSDGRYLFFISTRGGTSRIYWVDAGVVEGLRAGDPNE